MRIQNEIDYEYGEFLKDMKDPSFIFGTYMDEDEYEDEYSHNEIDEAIAILENKIKLYLHENKPNKFVVISGWNVTVVAIERARQSNMPETRIMDCLVR